MGVKRLSRIALILLLLPCLVFSAMLIIPDIAYALDWVDIGEPSSELPLEPAYSLVSDGTNLFASDDGKIYCNTDPGGAGAWKAIGERGGQLAYGGGVLYSGYGGDAEVYFNSDPVGGGTWNTAGKPGAGHVNCLESDGVNLYAGCEDSKVYYNPDPVGGGAWVPIPKPYPTGSPTILDPNGQEAPATIFALESVGTGLYAGCYGGGIYYNPDPAGVGDWTEVRRIEEGFTSNHVYDFAYDGHNLYAVYWYERCLYYNPDPLGGAYWNSFNTPGSVMAKSMACDDNYLYVSGANFKVWRTRFTYDYYFAEGYTGPGFQEYLSLGNPNDTATSATITYMFSDGAVKEQKVDVPPMSRTTVNVNAEVGPDREVSARVSSDLPMLAERPMYFNYKGKWPGGHVAVGATNPSSNWYFAEGYTGPGFEEWICVLNPGDNDTGLNFVFQTQEEGEIQRNNYIVPAHSRRSFYINEILGEGYQTSLHISGGAIVAERVMYFDYQGTSGHSWKGGHCSMGATNIQDEFYFAEGTTRAGFEEWITIQNQLNETQEIYATYQLGKGQGEEIKKTYVIPGKTRYTIYVPAEVGPDKDVSVHLTCKWHHFMAERPMYFDYRYENVAAQGGSCVMGAQSPASGWFLAEGYTGPGFEEWICIQNTGDAVSVVEITYYTQEEGALKPRVYYIPPHTRSTVMVNDSAGPNYQLSTGIRVVSGPDVVVERPMYFNFYDNDGGHVVLGKPF
jgi:hypothetical protein